ncbi:MAG: type VI secretion system lipoprotein TssJ [Polyangiaceae bacterium]
MIFAEPLNRLHRKGSFLVVLGASLMGCSSRAPAAKEPQAACVVPNPLLTITASDRVNENGGQGRPVQVRVYQLKSDARLQSAKFEDVWQKDAETFATDLVKMDEVPLFPGETKSVKITRSPDAQNLALVALFREPQGKSWFLTYELAPPKKEPPCPPAEPHLSVWVDRMQIEDGQGRSAEGTTAEPPASKEGAKGR